MIYKQLGWRYESPTMSLQILPEDFVKFCGDLRHYLETPLEEYKDISAEHKQHMIHFFGRIPTEWPVGIVDDVMIVFMHDTSFGEAAKKWNRRKARVDLDNVAYLFQAYNESYADCVKDFIDLGLPHSICLTEGFDYPGGCRFDIPAGCDGFSWVNGRRVIEDNFRVSEWLEL